MTGEIGTLPQVMAMIKMCEKFRKETCRISCYGCTEKETCTIATVCNVGREITKDTEKMQSKITKKPYWKRSGVSR